MKLTPWEPDLRSLVERIEAGDIDLQPDFQRQEVWSPSKKKRLIDTILRGWSIPPVHLVATTDNRLEVLDGQQRLASIRDFYANRLSIDGNVTPSDPNISRLHRKTYVKLDATERRRVDQYSLRCFRISDYLPEEPSELFYRLNQPTILTAGEQRNALYGPARVQLKDLVSYFIDNGNNSSSIGFSNTRLAYDDIFARLLYFIEVNSFAIKGTESRISERFRSQRPFSDDVYQKAMGAVDKFSAELVDSSFYRLNKASLISWLIFFCRWPNGAQPKGAMSAFAHARNASLDTHFANEAAALFEDRASLRVTDVSSVVLRDVALWYIYKFVLGASPPSIINSGALEYILDTLKSREDISFEEAASSAIDLESWGRLQ